MTKPTTKKAAAAEPEAPSTSTKKPANKSPMATTRGPAQASTSKLRKGTGTLRTKNRIITIYGTFKTRKTTSLRNLPKGRTKWIVSDSNCIPTLQALDAMPHDDDIYECPNVEEFRKVLEEMVTLCENEGPEALGIDWLAIDSYTQFSDWHQADVAKTTGQRFLGDDKANNGWQQFNAEFGACLDLIVSLSRYISVVGIVHAKDKFDPKKGMYSTFSLSPAMAERLGRMSNWILLKTFDEIVDDEKIAEAHANPDDEFYLIEDGVVFEDSFYTKPTSGWVASANSLKLKNPEPGNDLTVLLEKDGLL